MAEVAEKMEVGKARMREVVTNNLVDQCSKDGGIFQPESLKAMVKKVLKAARSRASGSASGSAPTETTGERPTVPAQDVRM